MSLHTILEGLLIVGIAVVLLLGGALLLDVLQDAHRRKRTGRDAGQAAGPTGQGAYGTALIFETSGLVYPLRKPVIRIGRAADNDLVLPDDTVSAHHAVLCRSSNPRLRWMVEDLQSRNGVYVNGRRTGKNLLRSGMRVSFGGTTALFVETGED